MSRMPSEERRRRLVEAAIVVMTRDGVAKATTRAIVGEADMRLGVFHYAFRDKQELLQNVVETITAHSLERVAEMAEERRTVRATVRATLQAYWDHVVANPAEHRLTYELTQFAMREPGFEDLARHQYDFYLRTMVAFLDDTAARLRVEWTVGTPVLARYLFTLLDGLTLSWLISGDDAGAKGVLDLAATHVEQLARPA